MNRLRELASRIWGLVGGGRRDAELEVELRFHLDMLADEHVRRGVPREEAVRLARLALGSLDGAKEACRDQRSVPWLETLRQDVRQAARSLRRAPAFTTAATVTLALGIGAVSVVLSLLKGVLLDPLPYPEPHRLVRVFESGVRFPRFPLSPANFLEYRREARTLTGLAAYTREDLQISGEGRPERLATLQVTSDYFSLLGFRPALGRAIEDRDLVKGAHVVVLSHGLWQRRFGGDAGVIGRAIRLNGEPWTIVGVMPRGLEHVGGDYRSPPQGETVEAWSPMPLDEADKQRSWHFLNGLGRLAPGATVAQAASELGRIESSLEARYPTGAVWQPRLVPLTDAVVGGDRPAVLLLTGGAALVLLVACANVAGLLLARSLARRRELVVRFALGASRGRLVRFLLAEAGLLATLGTALGLLIARASLPAVLALMPPDFPRLHAVSLDGGVVALTVGLSVFTVLLFGLAPAQQGTRGELQPALHQEGRASTAGGRALRTRSLIVVGELTLASALLVAAGLLVRSFHGLLATDPGFQPQGVLTFELNLPPRYETPQSRVQFHARLEERLAQLPGVEHVGLGSALPWTGWDENTGFGIAGQAASSGDEASARFAVASAGFFRALGVRLLEGRLPDASDQIGAPRVVVVNRALARTYFPDGAVGREIDLWDNKTRIVGVVADVKDAPAAAAAEPALFWPVSQQPFGSVVVALRTPGDPLDLVSAARTAVAGLDPELPLAEVRTLEGVTLAAHARRRFLLACVLGLAGLAVVLAAVGAYGALAYAVEQRRRELGVRVALGATRARILGLVVGQGLRLAAAGLALGALLALLAGRAIEGQLYGVTARDPWSFAGALLAIAVIAGLASLLPALQATRADPLVVLRAE